MALARHEQLHARRPERPAASARRPREPFGPRGPLSAAGRVRAAGPTELLGLQRVAGNRAVNRHLHGSGLPTALAAAGKTGNDPLEEGTSAHSLERERPTLEEGRRNEFGELDGAKESTVRPCAFVDGGKTGTAAVHWGGGGGGVGNQGVGDVTLVAPTYDGADPATAGAPASAWVNAGTGTATVTRSYTGVPVGANGAYWITASASARIDRHEERHVASTRSIHDANIVPAERRVAEHLGAAKARSGGTTRAEAIAALRTYIDWNTSIGNFRTADSAANAPGGTTDTTDQATADFYRDYGARNVGGTAYAHYIDTPPGPAAAGP